MTGAAIAGLGAAVPARTVSSEEMEDRLGLGRGWIESRTGILSRHVAGEAESVVTLATAAATSALDSAGIAPTDVDYVIVATVTPDFRVPAAASLLQDALGCDAAAYDLNAGCSGFLFALAQADALVRSGAARTVLVAGVDLMSRIVDFDDPKTGILFGDGAGAAVVTAVPEPRLGPFVFHSDGARPDLLMASRDNGKLVMAGREIYRRAVQEMTASVAEALAAADAHVGDVDLVVAHQANGRIIEAVGDRLGLPSHKVFTNVVRYGNTTAASIPIALRDAAEQGAVKDGDLVVLTAFGSGLAWGAGVVRWGTRSQQDGRLAHAGAARG